jgi:hypothetical protein
LSGFIDDVPREAHLAAAEELLQQSIQTVAAPPAAADSARPSAPILAAAAATAATAATTVTEEHLDVSSLEQQQGLCLRSFSSNLSQVVDMLAELQVQHLTRVELNLLNAVTDSSTLSLALARLSNLQQLRLDGMSDASLGAALTTLVQLPHLTLLECNGEWPALLHDESDLASPSALALQQLLAQPLPLKSLQLPVDGSYQQPVLNMALLTKLTELSTGQCKLAEASVLSAQLQRLHFHSWDGAHSMAALTRLELKQLQHLSLRVAFEQPQLLLQLAQLPALTHLALQYDVQCCVEHRAAATASAWPLLPQLRELEIAQSVNRPPSQSQWEAILAGAAAAVGLTKLALDPRMLGDDLEDDSSLDSDDDDSDDDEGWASQVAACASLTRLTCLKDLTIGRGAGYGARDKVELNLVHGAALALTALTGPTRLVLAGAQHGVGTAVATALARSLQQLQSLDLGDCCLQLGDAEGLACLEAIGRLTQLTQLSLIGNEGLTQRGLMQLTGLSRLEQAACDELCGYKQMPDEALAAFWAAVHAQSL